MMTTPRVLRRARRVVATGLVTAVAGFGLTSISSTPATAAIAPTSAVMVSPAIGTSSYENRVQHWINVRRSHHGLHTLTVASCTDQVAEKWGRYLAVNDEFFHQSMTTILNKCNAYYAGETLGRGAISPKRLVYLWMHSPEHRQVLLSKYPRRIGIGAYPDAFGQWVVAADFMKF